MPIRRINAKQSEKFPEILHALEQEIKSNVEATTASPESPYIVEEPANRGRNLHVLVIWNQWKDVPKQERSRLILDAYEAVKGEEEMLKILFALGLTWDEAEKTGHLDALNLQKTEKSKS